MRTFWLLTIANLKSYLRDRGGMFWTLAFPVVFMVLFGAIFSGNRDVKYSVAWVDLDRSQQAVALRDAVSHVAVIQLEDESLEAARDAMTRGNVQGIVVVPQGYGAALPAGSPGSSQAGSASAVAPVTLTLYVDPSQQTTSTTLQQIVGQIVQSLNQQLSGRPPAIAVQTQSIQTENLSAVAYFVPSVLAMALMQLGLFGALPIVEQRQKLILKRLGATPLKRSTLVASNAVVRLLIGVAQAVVILGIGVFVFKVQIVGNLLLVGFLVVLGAAMFVALGYVVAAFARTEDAASAATSVLQFPLMFLSGIFFPFEIMPGFMRSVGALMPLTYLGDAMRQVMVSGSAFAPLGVDIAVLAAWLVGCLAISARFFRWE